MKPHAFVAMPFGVKKGPNGESIDFNRVYAEYLEPALKDAGFEVFRADQEQRAGDIREDMFQELLISDLVVADLTLDNPNVWYELGVRHALRARGVLLVQGPRPYQPFGIYTDRKLRYALKDGAPDPTTIQVDRENLTAMARATWEAPYARKVSPVYALLDHLQEPAWQDLLLEAKNEFSESYEAWASRMEIALQKNRPGDLLVLADETPTRALRLEAKRKAGNCLVRLRHFDFALEQFEAALEIDPTDKSSREMKAKCLGRLGRYEEAREWVRGLTRDYPTDPEVWTRAGRVEMDNWIARWRRKGSSPAEMRAAAAAEDASLSEAIQPYHNAFIADPAHYYSGINSLVLHHLQRHLGGEVPAGVLENLLGGVLWATLAARTRSPKDYRARASYAELSLLVNPQDSIVREFRGAVAAANRDWSALDSTRQTLHLLRDLEFRPAETAAALDILEREISRAAPPFEPRQVFLFSGHRVDEPGRKEPRFPLKREGLAAGQIAKTLDGLKAGPGDLALAQAASGGDILFLEACLDRGVRCQVRLPFEEPRFIEQSILSSDGGETWRQRYFDLKARLQDPLQIMPEELGRLPKGINPYERCNRWSLYSALAWGVAKVAFICLWNGGGGDGPGGTAHMYNEVKRRTGRVHWIDTREFEKP